jgi:hypothetical protein
LSFVKLVVLSFLQGQLHVAGLIQYKICLLTVCSNSHHIFGILRETSITLLGIFGSHSHLHIQFQHDSSLMCSSRRAGSPQCSPRFSALFSTACSFTSMSTGLRMPSTLQSALSRCCGQQSICFSTSFIPFPCSTSSFRLRSTSSPFCFCSVISVPPVCVSIPPMSFQRDVCVNLLNGNAQIGYVTLLSRGIKHTGLPLILPSKDPMSHSREQ